MGVNAIDPRPRMEGISSCVRPVDLEPPSFLFDEDEVWRVSPRFEILIRRSHAGIISVSVAAALVILEGG